jgi:hypothetical protein
MWSLIIGGLGALVGAFTPIGPFIGFAIGAALGGIGESIFAGEDTTVTKGPRLSDLKVQTSNYGVDIPKIYVMDRVAGNVFWAKEIEEKRKIRHLDGDAEFWEYKYYCSFAVGLCDGPIIGVRKIWLNGKLYVDLSSEINFGLTKSVMRLKNMAIYLGTESQTADEEISDDLGAANTPAYRGLAYIRFTDLNLKNYSNRIPEVTAEVIESGSDLNEDFEFVIEGITLRGMVLDQELNMIVHCDDGNIRMYNGISNELLQTIPGPTLTQSYGGSLYPRGICIRNNDLYSVFTRFDTNQNPTYIGPYVARHDGFTASIVETWDLGLNDINCGDIIYYNDRFVIQVYADAKIYCYAKDQFDLQWSISMFGSTNHTGLTVDEQGNLIEADGTGFSRRNSLNGSLLDSINMTSNGPCYFEKNNLLFITSDYAAPDTTIKIYDDFSTTQLKTGRLNNTTVSLDEIVSDICTEVEGISASEIDVTDLASTECRGYVRTGVMPARRALEPLMAAYQFDAAEIDHKIHFIKRGGANQATIAADDLAAHEYGAEMPEKYNYIKQQEIDVPAEFNLNFIDANRHYQEGGARSIRYSLNNDNISKVEFPIVMTATEGKQLAEIMHNTAYTERTRLSFETWLEYLYLAPTDVITVDGYKMRIEQMAIAGGLLQISGPLESDANYTSNATTDDPAFNDQPIENEGPTNYKMLDIPMLSDFHNDAGFYIAVQGLLAGWVGAQAYLGASDTPIIAILESSIMGVAENALSDASALYWDTTNTLTVQLNKTSDTLSSKTEQQVYERQNWAALGVDGAWEIIGFKTVVSNGAGNYTLSNLLRGLKNTAPATGGHAANDFFIILDLNGIGAADDGDLGRYNPGESYIGVARDYKVISLHADPGIYTSFSFTNNALGLKPYPPTQIAGSRDVSDNLTITWVRAGRIQNGWDDYQDVPIGEDSESYEVDIMDGSTVKRTITATSETASYTAAQQTTDFGSTQSSVDVKIYQISATVGRGYAGEATI